MFFRLKNHVHSKTTFFLDKQLVSDWETPYPDSGPTTTPKQAQQSCIWPSVCPCSTTMEIARLHAMARISSSIINPAFIAPGTFSLSYFTLDFPNLTWASKCLQIHPTSDQHMRFFLTDHGETKSTSQGFLICSLQ